MLDLGWSETFFVVVLALIVIGPRDLPKVARGIGQALGRARKAYQEVLGSLNTLEREVMLEDSRANEVHQESLRARQLTPEALQERQRSRHDPHSPVHRRDQDGRRVPADTGAAAVAADGDARPTEPAAGSAETGRNA